MRDEIQIRGLVHVVLRPVGWPPVEFWGRNLVTTVGKNQIANCVEVSPGPTRPTHFGFGSGFTTPVVGDTTLATEVARQAFSGTSRTGNEVTYAATYTAGSAYALREMGIFDAGAAGNLWARFLTQEVNLGIGDQLDIDWTLNFGG